MVLDNCGLTTTIRMIWDAQTQSHRIVTTTQPMGDIKTTSYDRIHSGTDAVDTFHHLCEEAITQEYKAPDRNNGTTVSLVEADLE